MLFILCLKKVLSCLVWAAPLANSGGERDGGLALLLPHLPSLIWLTTQQGLEAPVFRGVQGQCLYLTHVGYRGHEERRVPFPPCRNWAQTLEI